MDEIAKEYDVIVLGTGMFHVIRVSNPAMWGSLPWPLLKPSPTANRPRLVFLAAAVTMRLTLVTRRQV